MNLSIILRPQAEADLIDVRDWYATQSPGLEIAFAESPDHILIRIAAMPQMYAVAFRDVRRGRLRRFPYVVYYRVACGLNRSDSNPARQERSHTLAGPSEIGFKRCKS